MRGHGPVQFVKKNSATHTLPASDDPWNSLPACDVRTKSGTVPYTGSGLEPHAVRVSAAATRLQAHVVEDQQAIEYREVNDGRQQHRPRPHAAMIAENTHTVVQK